jgi:hypothetical protein
MTIIIMITWIRNGTVCFLSKVAINIGQQYKYIVHILENAEIMATSMAYLWKIFQKSFNFSQPFIPNRPQF